MEAGNLNDYKIKPKIIADESLFVIACKDIRHHRSLPLYNTHHLFIHPAVSQSSALSKDDGKNQKSFLNTHYKAAKLS
jgi:hypothetical protein